MGKRDVQRRLRAVAEQAACGIAPVLDAADRVPKPVQTMISLYAGRSSWTASIEATSGFGRPRLLFFAGALAGPVAYFSIAHGPEALYDITFALVDESAAEIVGEKSRRRRAAVGGCTHRDRLPAAGDRRTGRHPPRTPPSSRSQADPASRWRSGTE